MFTKIRELLNSKNLPRLGVVGAPLPSGFVHSFHIREYLESEGNEGFPIQVVGNEGCLGRAWNHGPLHFELYYGDSEPSSTPLEHSRIVLWQPLMRLNVPRGWRHLWFPTETARQIGFAEIRDVSYWNTWTPNAQRDRKIWLNNKDFEIVESDHETFLREYPHDGVYRNIRSITFGTIRRKIFRFGEAVHFFVARHVASGEIGGMVALVDLSFAGKAYYLAAFVKKTAKHSLITTGLIDRCFGFCIANNIRFLDFGGFWAPGAPSSWKGFSRFKQKFGVTLLRYPPMMWRIIKRNN